MVGSDRDANVHHWAWALVMGAEYGLGGSTINTGREIVQAWQYRRDWNWTGTWSDVLSGNAGASLGFSFRVLGIRRIQDAWYIHMMEWAY